MKRIVFILQNPYDDSEAEEYKDYLAKEGFPYELVIRNDFCAPEYEDLICTDSLEVYRALKDIGEDAVVCVKDAKTAGSFPGAKYVTTDAFDTEAEYYERVWRRFRNLPWFIASTERLILRETVEEDVDTFYELYKDPEMTRYTAALYEDPKEEKKYVTEYRNKVYAVSGFGIWTVLLKDSEKIIGRAGLISRAGFEGVEVGFVIGTEYQGKGYATEVVKECMEIAHKLFLSPVYALVMDGNEKSKRVCERCGFVKTGETKLSGEQYCIYTFFE